MRTITGLIGLLATVCSAQQPLIQAASNPDEIPFSQIEIGMDSKIKKSGVVVIKDAETWKQFLVKIDEVNQKHPKIDWTKFQVVVATMEGSSKDGVTLAILRLHKTQSGKADIEFQMLKDNSSSNRYVDQSNSHNTLGKEEYPYAILQTPKSDIDYSIKVLG